MYHHLLYDCADFCLDCDVAVCAMDDTTGWKTPALVSHVLDCRLVLAREGYTCQDAAAIKLRIRNARHTVRDRQRHQAAAIVKCRKPNASHTRRDRHRRQAAAIDKR